MGWFKNLKDWQKGGLILGGGHFFLYFLILFASLIIPAMEYILIFLEMPWGVILKIFGFHPVAPPNYLGLVGLGLIGTLFYFCLGTLLGRVLGKTIERGK